MTDQLSPKEIALNSLDCGGHTCNNFKAVNNAIDIALQEQAKQDKEYFERKINVFFDFMIDSRIFNLVAKKSIS